MKFPAGRGGCLLAGCLYGAGRGLGACWCPWLTLQCSVSATHHGKKLLWSDGGAVSRDTGWVVWMATKNDHIFFHRAHSLCLEFLMFTIWFNHLKPKHHDDSLLQQQILSSQPTQLGVASDHKPLFLFTSDRATSV